MPNLSRDILIIYLKLMLICFSTNKKGRERRRKSGKRMSKMTWHKLPCSYDKYCADRNRFRKISKALSDIYLFI